MSEIVIKPSSRVTMLLFILALVIALVIMLYGMKAKPPFTEYWYVLFVIPGGLILWALSRQMSRSFTKITIVGDKLRYDSGIAAKTTRNIPLAKVQDVRVNRSVLQQLIGVGDLSIETAGESSRLQMQGIDDPQVVAEKILELASQYHKK